MAEPISINGYLVFFEQRARGWYWTRTREAHHPAPSTHWAGPFSDPLTARSAAEEDAKRNWRGWRALRASGYWDASVTHAGRE